MCEPVTALTAISGGISAFGGLAAARDQKAAQGRDWARQMQLRAINFQRDQGRYRLKLARYNQELDENALAASAAFANEQAWLNDQFNQASVQYRDAFIKASKGLKYYGEGKTAKRLASLNFQELGRLRGMQVSNLIRATERVEGFGRASSQKLRLANQRSRDSLGEQPLPGIAPPKPDMSMTGASINFLGSLVGTAASAYGAYQKSLPPTKPFSTPNSPGTGLNISGIQEYMPSVTDYYSY